ncbi:PspC domain-containing protein [Carboxylicivirga sp. N1Y90]|uniref:PspC domain-containing protein n=1 Tax=Carboxylicivirga fragile TaxID=3417571 RepID=UPI003D3537E9|nr:PspC domain-containing protein [Marinilabiliaceae bacterium N1Y90]
MNKTIDINLDGCAFQVEEQAFEKLKSYLDTIKKRLGKSEEAEEILADIEARIAELFQYKCSGSTINLAVVEEIIETIGEPAEIVDEDEADETNQESNKTYSAPPPYYGRKGLYRDCDDRVFAGVCGGLGAYFDVDPLVFRIIAVVTALLSLGSPILIYIVLWIAMPEARTMEQRIRMRGGVTFKNVGDNIKQEYQAVSNKFRSYANKPNYKNMQQRMNKTGDAMATGLHSVLNVFGTILGIGIVLWSVLCIMIIVGVIVLKDAMPGLALSEGNFFITTVPDHFLSHLDQLLATIAVLLLVVIPFLVILYLGLKLIFRFKTNGKVIGMSALGLWLAGLVLLFFTGLRVAKSFSDSGSITETHQLQTTSAETVYLRVANNTTPVDQEYLADVDNLELSLADEQLLITGDPHINIIRGDDFSIKITKKARGLNDKAAEFNAVNTEYFWEQKDSVIYLDKIFNLGDEALMRKQKVYIDIEIPENKSLEVSPYLDRLIDNY